MTLKEILDRSDFKEVAKVLKQHYPEQATCMAQFKEAFDALRQLEPKLNPNSEKSQNIIELELLYYDEWEREDKDKDYYIGAHYCGGDFWESDLAKEVVMSDGLKLTDNEIIAYCLWEMTFYGNQQDEEEFEEVGLKILGKIDTSNPYAVEAERLWQKMFDNYLPKKYRGQESIPIEVEPRTRKNRIKRRRDYKLEKKIEKLERMARVERAIRFLTFNTSSFTKEELQYLFDTNLICEKKYCSWVKNVEQRVDYLIDLLSNYESTDFSELTHFLLMFRTSSKYPLSQKEKDMLQDFFNKFLPSSVNIRYGYGIDDKLDMEIKLFLLGSC